MNRQEKCFCNQLARGDNWALEYEIYNTVLQYINWVFLETLRISKKLIYEGAVDNRENVKYEIFSTTMAVHSTYH